MTMTETALEYVTEEDRQAIDAMASQRLRWSGLLAPYNRPSADGRIITGQLAVRDLPLYLSWQPATAEGHDGAVPVGRILQVDNRSDGIYGSGDLFDPADYTGTQADAIRAAAAMLRDGLGQISVDLVGCKGEYRGDQLWITSGTLAGSTLVGAQAFDDARVAVDEAVAAAAEQIVATELDQLSMSFAASLHLDTRPVAAIPADPLPNLANQVTRPRAATTTNTIPARPPAPVLDGETHVFTVTGSTSLPIGPSRSWDGDGARRRMVDAARRGDGGVNVAQASRGFFWRDGDGQNQGDYKLPFADIVDGSLQVIPSGVSAAASFLERTDIPASAKASIRRKIDRLQARIRRDESASALMSLDDRMRTAEVDDLARRAGI